MIDADLLAQRGDGLAHRGVRVYLQLQEGLQELAQEGWIFSQDELLQFLQERSLGRRVGGELGVVEELHGLVVGPALLLLLMSATVTITNPAATSTAA